MERQFVASVYILDDDKVLLIHHRKLQKWLPPGGHIDPNETPSEAAKREAFEETGLEIALISEENVWVQCWNAKSLPRPYLCLLEEIPAYHDKPAHQHIDLIYLGRPIGGQLQENEAETQGIRWFSLKEIEELESDTEIFEETKQVIQAIFSKWPLDLVSTKDQNQGFFLQERLPFELLEHPRF